MVKIGDLQLFGDACPLPRERARAKRTLKSIAKMVGVPNVYFVRTTKAPYGGYFNQGNGNIVVVEQYKSQVVPMYVVVYRFFHELTHHMHREAKIFNAYYYQEVKIGRKKKKYTRNDCKRVALRAENHANQKACELADEFFGMLITSPEYSREFLHNYRRDIFG